MDVAEADGLTVTCRAARPEDKQEMLEITRTIWDGKDYVPRVWDEWLADESGLLAVAVTDGRVRGFGKLTRLSEQSWWLEGLRVHPEFEGRGIATRLHEYLTAAWRRIGSGVLRLATSAERVQVHRMCARSRFSLIGERVLYQALSLEQGGHHFTPIEKGDLEAALRVIASSQLVRTQSGLIDLGWQWAVPVEELLLDPVADQRAYWWKGAGTDAVLLYMEDEPGEDEPDQPVIPTIQLLACPLESLANCLHDFRRLAAGAGFESAAWVAPYQPEVIAALESAGYQRQWEGSLYLFAKS